MIKPEVYNYSDYRAYLQAFVAYKRRAQPQWTYGQWARSLGLKATTSITMVINGQRHPGEKLALSMAKYLELDPKERAHFLNLIEFAKLEDHTHLKDVLKKELLKLSAKKPPVPLDPNVFTAVSNWYFLVLRQIARTPYFSNNPQELKEAFKFAVSQEELQHALEVLKKLGLLVINEDGKFKASSQTIVTEHDVAREAVKIYHEQVIRLAQKGIRKFGVDERQYSALTLPISKQKLTKAKELIRRFVDEFDQLIDDADGADVYQLNVQFFPMAECKKINSNKKGTE